MLHKKFFDIRHGTERALIHSHGNHKTHDEQYRSKGDIRQTTNESRGDDKKYVETNR